MPSCDVELTLQSLLRQLERHHNLTHDLDVSPIEVREMKNCRYFVDFFWREIFVLTVLVILY